MAYVPSNPDDDEEQRRASASNAPGSFGDTTPTSTPTKTNFVNVSDYLDKNPNASEHLGDLASSKLSSQRDETQASLDQAKSGFGQQVQAGTTELDNDFLSSAFSSPETFTQDPNNTARFHALRDASYKGPSSLESTDIFAPTQSKITALNQAGQGLGTEAGRTKLVEGLSTNPTHGKSALNQLILQGNPAAAQKISDTAATFGNVDSQWQQFVQDAPNQVNQARSTTDATRAATRAGLDEATQTFSKGLTDQTAKATNERDAFNLNFSNMSNKLNNGSGSDLNQQELDSLGMSDAFPYLSKLNDFNSSRGLSYYNNPVQLSGFLNPGRANSNIPTQANTATPEQYAREAALQQMAGHDLGLPDQQGTPYQANGQMPTLDYMGAFNKAGSDLQAADNAFLGGGTWMKDASGNYTGALQQGASPLGADADQIKSIYARQTQPDYYTNPATGAGALPGYQTAPPPAGWDANQPAPYPAPTSNPPQGLIQPRWNPYIGQWEGAQLQPNTPPPTQPPASGGGGGKIFYSQGYTQ